MTILNNLLEMLQKVKEENPEMANRIEMASEVLNIEDDEEKIEEEEEEEEEPEEEFDDTYIPLSEEDSKKIVSFTNKLNASISDFGTYMRDHEVLKVSKLQAIEGLRDSQEKLVESLREKCRLNPDFNYRLVQEGSVLVFIKKES